MCGMNLAFDRTLIGPAMYFGLMGHGQPIGRYDDMWAGWCTKVRALPDLPRRRHCCCCCCTDHQWAYAEMTAHEGRHRQGVAMLAS